ncbi:RNA polymerase sigma-70 factor [Sphingobacterium sp. BN32]|uniref:RNA polymerase sigma-70 factor n=1 Tax=Sphingobacterium sp. BN32 TaxID=3058432 RepID=UPI00265D1225|nr:RNA polymerase sigma-70 factor [Sphingobacterium sp. BN32]WKK58559.1 RNA polymerase sigma-70 factor [Sphingobacterium sp. BN32]
MESVERLFKTYFLRLESFAIHWVREEQIAKDIVQDAFLNLLEQADILVKSEIVIKSYLYSTVKNMSLNYLRNNQTRSRINSSFIHVEEDQYGLMDNLIRAEVMGELYEELSKLPEGCQHICRLIYFNGMKYEEVAQELNVSINTVKTQRQRALRLLRIKILKVLFILFY